jgi:undecaprenyl pyrophosphate synthase
MENKKIHLMFIPDGNRRWAIENNKTFCDSYYKASKKLIKIIDWTFNSKSIYKLSFVALKV